MFLMGIVPIHINMYCVCNINIPLSKWPNIPEWFDTAAAEDRLNQFGTVASIQCDLRRPISFYEWELLQPCQNTLLFCPIFDLDTLNWFKGKPPVHLIHWLHPTRDVAKIALSRPRNNCAQFSQTRIDIVSLLAFSHARFVCSQSANGEGWAWLQPLKSNGSEAGVLVIH